MKLVLVPIYLCSLLCSIGNLKKKKTCLTPISQTDAITQDDTKVTSKVSPIKILTFCLVH